MVTIPKLTQIEEIEQCEKLPIAYKLWGTVSSISSFGQLGYVEDQEVVVKLTAVEKNPLTNYEQDEAPVYKDSALEVFLNFNIDKEQYLNLEVNASGALLCHFGQKGNRGPIAAKTDQKVIVQAKRMDTEWSVLLRIPHALIQDCFGDTKLRRGSKISFNLYKICESEENMHFISHTLIPTEKPDFHQPAYFAEGVLG